MFLQILLRSYLASNGARDHSDFALAANCKLRGVCARLDLNAEITKFLDARGDLVAVLAEGRLADRLGRRVTRIQNGAGNGRTFHRDVDARSTNPEEPNRPAMDRTFQVGARNLPRHRLALVLRAHEDHAPRELLHTLRILLCCSFLGHRSSVVKTE